MRTRAAVSGVFASLAILIVGWQAGASQLVDSTTASGAAPAGTSTTGSAGSGTTGSGTTGTGSTSSGPAGTESSTSASATAIDGTFTGSTVTTRFGPVQVQIQVSAGTITDVSALQLTGPDRKSVQISNRAEPILQSEVLQSQSSSISMVSGATYTSDAYITSLQSALDQAGL